MKLRFSWLGVITFFILMFTIAPFLVIVPSSFTSENFVSFPPEGLSLKWYTGLLDMPGLTSAVIFSLQLAIVTAILSTVIGTLAGLCIAKYNFKGKQTINTLLLSPLALPALIIGIALLVYFTYLGLAGSFTGLLLAHILITIPYVIRFVLTGMATFDDNLEKAAAIMGAKPIRIFWDVTFPLIRPAVISGTVFSFLISFDNVTISLFLVSAENMTLPLLIFNYIQQNLSPLISAVSTVVILISLIPILIIEKIYGLDRLFGLNSNSH
ncbi:ABC transporter permease [Domibacillus sp. PGB-M46]|nr:ABC transporter permease [Domibacillus sp. PGB-M46]MCI2256444.1 ABC transporter permease [Domibacillus sp. PGB-M46]